MDESRNVLNGVVCSVDSCVYHTKGNKCTAGSIAVKMESNMAKKKDETLCATFENQVY